MTTVVINENSYECSNKTETLGDFLNGKMVTDKFTDYIVTSIHLDGCEEPFENYEKLYLKKIQQYDNIKFLLESELDIAFEALQSCTVYIDHVALKIDRLVELYAGNENNEANQLFIEVIETMDLFIQLISSIHKTFKKKVVDYDKSKTIQELEIHLLSVLKALLPAKEREDIIMLCDLLQYELKENLVQWKIKAVPELKKVKDSNTVPTPNSTAGTTDRSKELGNDI